MLVDLDRALDEVARDASLSALVVTGKEPLSFAAGADVETIVSMQDPALAGRFVRLLAAAGPGRAETGEEPLSGAGEGD